MLKARMEKCLSNHSQCSALGEGGPRPGRVLYIEDPKSLAVRLVDDTSSMEPQPYACLSHRWTEQTESSSLTLDRLETFKKQIPTDLLYPLLRDAFEAAGRLGFRYMWIDCLCICQDDLDDWNRQASGMSAIYENAVVTISALDAQINDWRLFAKHPPEKTQKLCTRDGQTIMISELNKEHPFFVDTVGTKYRASSVEKGFPLLTRGWVYQERLLARRIIHFTRNEVIWECKEAMSCECGHNEGAWKMVKREAPSLSDMTWSGICAEYTKTELSIDADKLPALSGVARRFGEAHGWTYLAGVWREDPDLCALLLWFSSKSHVRKRIPGLPSWSWASVEAARFFPVFHQHRMLFRVVAHEVVPGAVPYSTPASAKLVIEGRCSPVTIKFKAGSSEDGILTFSGEETQHTCFMDYVRDESEKKEIEQSSDIVFFLCFRDEDGPCGLLLKPVGREENTYERIALFSLWGSIEESSLDRKRITLA
ncbi:putative het domain protein [Phaeoacremonium minimum UCRPA7]|uniref:Putative het domain protein n=1 Tax=Phaeoacremonium minimum (strain UCR-PA7) TaxID=1286976 RepID=R8B8Y8_PHAM7|nr:putative het domain protein [Phaeoacremonium minimum UCRPA7]EON95747.1 putative het domain protein [Phaeoacremonium minimum UCRPA7]